MIPVAESNDAPGLSLRSIPKLRKGGDHHGKVKWKGVSRQLQQLRRVVPDQGQARAGEQLEEVAHGIRLLWAVRSAGLLTAGRGAP